MESNWSTVGQKLLVSSDDSSLSAFNSAASGLTLGIGFRVEVAGPPSTDDSATAAPVPAVPLPLLMTLDGPPKREGITFIAAGLTWEEGEIAEGRLWERCGSRYPAALSSEEDEVAVPSSSDDFGGLFLELGPNPL